jgi:hypothetical protein
MDAAPLVADIFGDHVRLSGAQVTDTRAPTYKKWLILVGILATNANLATLKFKISIQLLSFDRSTSQPIKGHNDSLAELTLHGAMASKSFTFPAQTARDAKVRYFPPKSDMHLTFPLFQLAAHY